jgi:hypothetical protein
VAGVDGVRQGLAESPEVGPESAVHQSPSGPRIMGRQAHFPLRVSATYSEGARARPYTHSRNKRWFWSIARMAFSIRS